MDYREKNVLITGSAAGIGEGIARAYAKVGATVILADINESKGRELEAEIRESGNSAFFYQIDVQQADEIRQMFMWVAQKWGKLDILINNAGISKFPSLYEMTTEDWDTILNVNLRSMFVTAQEFAKLNKGTKYGRIINMASTRFMMSEPNSEAYAASKGGIVSLTHALAISLGHEQITVNCISPGWIQTTDYDKLSPEDHSQHPSLRVGKTDDIARTCLFLTDQANDFINGQNIIVDGGMTKKMIYM